MRVAVIPARGGSRRIPRKNIRLFHGRPMICYSIDVAKGTKLFDRIVVSTEDEEIADVASSNGAEVWVRSEDMAEDHVGTQEVVQDVLLAEKYVDASEVCCIYATAPTLLPEDIHAGHAAMLARVQYAYIHGWFYWGYATFFCRGIPLTYGIELPHPESRWIDINTEADWRRAEEMCADLRKVAA